ncbi:hypothetical protein TNCV_781361 [Trichonephila clavipes]|nr:hypothetical protein TNCV_781361 [Trichonephila clavipes]
MPFEQQGMSTKKGKELRRPLEHLKMWNEFPRLNSYNLTMISQFFLPSHQERDLDNVLLQQDGATVHTFRVSKGILRAAFPE